MRHASIAIAIASLLASLFGCALTLAACGGHAAPGPLATKVYIDSAGDTGVSGMGASVGVPGQVVLIESDDPASAGHWSLKLPSGVTLAGSKYDDPATAPGEKNVRSFTFSIAQPGTYLVRGSYLRPGHGKSARGFTLQIYGNPPGWPPPNLVFTTAHNGLGTNPGQTFAIALRQRPGGAWVLHFGPGLKALRQMTVTPTPSSNPAVDDAGQHRWLFRVEKAGTTFVTGSISGPAASGVPSDTFALRITATPPGS